MKFAIFLVLTALFGIVSSGMVCVQFKAGECAAKFENDYNDMIYDLCRRNEEYTDCFRKGARECGMESAPIIEELLHSKTETCTEGTEMNALYKKHKTCMFKHTSSIETLVCAQPMIATGMAQGPLQQTREYQEKYMKAICKYVDSVDKCIDDTMNSTCGAETVQFRHRLGNPSFRLGKMTCEEVGVRTNELHYSHHQHHDHSVHVLPPHIQHLSAVGSQAGSIQITSTAAP